jgi:hypothetical protein
VVYGTYDLRIAVADGQITIREMPVIQS